MLVVAGAGSTAICADLGARTIREEIDALEVLGIDPIHRLVVPRVVASTFVALLLNGAVITIGLVGGFIFGVYLQNVSAGAYVSTLTLVTGLPEVLISIVKATTFGLIAGLVGCYRGLTVSGGAKGVGTAVNETLVLCVIALFAVNVVLTTIGVRFGTGQLTCRHGRRSALPVPAGIRPHRAAGRRARPGSSTASGTSRGSSSRRSARSGTRCATTARRRCG